MNKFLKRAVGCLASAAIFFSGIGYSYAESPFLIYERKASENISSGVVHEHIQKFTSQGWWNINVLRVDLDDRYTEIGALFSSQGVSKREKITDMMKNSNAIAAINADFFSTVNNPSPLGAVVSNGEMVSSPAHPTSNMPVLSLDNNNFPMISYWQWGITVTPENGGPLNVTAINKDSRFHEEIIIYNRNWSTQTLGNKLSNDMVEIVVKNDVVTEVRVGQPPMAMPENGYTIVGGKMIAQTLINSFPVGTKVMLDITSIPYYEDINTAVGGGTYLVKDGKRAEFTLNVKGDHPRTAVGINEDRDELIFVTIDGRDTSFKGVSQEVFADIMISLGAYEAINYDGGGSTTMAIAPLGQESPQIVNKPSDGVERKVVDGLGIYNNAPESSLSYIQVYTDDSNMFENTTREFYIKGFDKYHNPVKVDLDDVTFSVNGIDGSFKDNILKAEEAGVGTVKARYKNETAETKINVLGNVKDIDIDISEISIDVSSQEALGEIYGKNQNGYTTKINPNDITWNIVGNIGKVSDGIFYSNDKIGTGAITATLGDAVENILVSVGYNESMVNTLDNINSVKFEGYPATVTGNLQVDSNKKEGSSSIKLSYDFTKSDDTRAAYVLLGDKGATLQGQPDRVGMWVYGNEGNSWLRGKIVDNSGKAYNIDFASRIDWKGWKWVTAEIPSYVSYPVNLERIYVVEVNPLNKVTGSIIFDSIKTLYPPEFSTLVLPPSTKLVDEYEKHVEKEQNGFTFAIGNSINNFDNLLKYHINSAMIDTMNQSDIGIFMGKINSKYSTGINVPTIQVTNGYSAVPLNGTMFIQLDTSNGGLRAANPQQWLWLKDTLSKSKEKNIVILLPTPIFGTGGFVDKLEADLLNETLNDYRDQGKNIWVIHGGSDTNVELKDGVRYVEIDTRELGTSANIFDIEYMKFTVNGENITYQILPLFTK